MVREHELVINHR